MSNPTIAYLRSVENVQQLAEVLVNAAHTLCPFERVMVYRFDQRWHGQVIAEHKTPDLPPYLNLYFPAHHIPAPARELYRQNVSRLILNPFAEQVPLLPEENPLTRELNLSRSYLRGLSPFHTAYLQNMGVNTSFSLPLCNRHTLWGLVVCHFQTVRPLSYETRRSLELLVQVASATLMMLVENEGYRDLLALKQNRIRLFDAAANIANELLNFRYIMARYQMYHKNKFLMKHLQQHKIELQAQNAQLLNTQKTLFETLQKAEQANTAKSSFLANLSHELRPPLNGILGYAQILLRDTQLSPHHKEQVKIMQQSGNYLIKLIEDILDLSKIEADALQLNPQSFSLAALLQETVHLFELRIQQKQLIFNYDCAATVSQSVQGDEKRVRQVLFNLLGNAVKFTESRLNFFKPRLSKPEPFFTHRGYRYWHCSRGIREHFQAFPTKRRTQLPRSRHRFRIGDYPAFGTDDGRHYQLAEPIRTGYLFYLQNSATQRSLRSTQRFRKQKGIQHYLPHCGSITQNSSGRRSSRSLRLIGTVFNHFRI